MADKPKSEGTAPNAGGEDLILVGRIGNIEDDVRRLDKIVDSVDSNNKFIITVLFATFLVIIVAIGLAIIAGHKITIKL